MWSPSSNSIILIEGVGTGASGTIVTWSSGVATRVISSVVWSYTNPDQAISPIILQPSDLILEWAGSSFKFISTFNTWFSRKTTFISEKGEVDGIMIYSEPKVVQNPIELPDDTFAAYIIDSPPRYIDLFFAISGTEIPIDPEDILATPSSFTDIWQCRVQHDYDANITAVRTAVNKGINLNRYITQGGTA
jgi:hypothetical protein